MFTFLAHQLISGGDTYEWFAFMSVIRDNIIHVRHPFADSTLLAYPVGFKFGFGFDGAYADLVGGNLGLILPMIVSYNLTILVVILTNIILSAYCFYRIALLWSEGSEILLRFKSTIAGIFFGLSPFVIARLNGHLHLAFVASFPLFVFALAQFDWQARNKCLSVFDLSLIPLALFVLAIGALEYVVFFAGFILLFVSPVIIKRWRTYLQAGCCRPPVFHPIH